ncbi:aminopeptidase [Flavobacterium sp.]|uniref:aminopeptidase n=1 Tax=Flavobacterium sp. TaxID=239 RepID=UPI0037BFF855
MKKLHYIILLIGYFVSAQHHSKMVVEVDDEKKTATVFQELIFFNQTNDTLTNIVLNDWMNAYGNKNSDIGKRFADEFERAFHLAKEKDRGRTENITISNQEKSFLTWERNENRADVIQVRLQSKLLPKEKITLYLTYTVKIPNARFTKYGYYDDGGMYLKNWFLTPARYENKAFVKNNNNNLDDIANALCDYDLLLKINQKNAAVSDLDEIQLEIVNNQKHYSFSGKNRMDFSLFIDSKKEFEIFKNEKVEVVTNFKDNRINDLQRALVIDKISNWVNERIGNYPNKKIVVSKIDYERNPFYGLNQLPAFIAPFPDEFMYEIKFLKTYINTFIHSTINLNPRDDNWIYDGMQVYLMMKYIEEFYPGIKMMGNVSKFKPVKGYNLVSLDFNGQYSYFYMLMARKNLDQQLNIPKDKLIKFNEKIASKYRSGLSLKYLNDYSESNLVDKTIPVFYNANLKQQRSADDFESLLKQNSTKKIDWYFDKIINSRETFDYKFDAVTKTKDSISFRLKNKTETNVPISIYGTKNREIVFKKWIDALPKDSLYTISRNEADRIIINYKNEVPEFNLRNNWRSLKGLRLSNRPIKFIFFKDLEDPNYNQIIYLPTLEFNIYDGFYPGMRFHNKTILDKPFIFDINPTYSTKTQSLTGKGSILFNQFNRNSNLYHIRYLLSGNTFHYAPEARYFKVTPIINFRIRPDDYRDNKIQSITFKQTIIDREKSNFTTSENTENYSVFSAKYYNGRTEITNHYNFITETQFSKNFGKLQAEMQYRRLFDNNRQLNIRVFAGTFLYNTTTTNFFDFGLDRPSDYLFESDYLGRSETKGIFSQQSIVADGFFKSIFETRFANRWMATTNLSCNVWNWVEVYGDIGAFKNKNIPAQFVYDSGIRLNLVTDYFELYLPIYSSNGWEIGQQNYGERIRFIITFQPDTLVSLFTRKWF